MLDSIEIKNNRGENVGFISFDKNPDQLAALRTAGGFKLTLPATISLKTVAKNQPIPLLSNLRAVLTINHESSSPLEVASIEGASWYTSGESVQPHTPVERQTHFRWSASLAQLAVLERAREGKPPRFWLQLWGELSYLLPAPPAYPYHQLRTEPHEIQGGAILTYAKELWVGRLRSIGVMENVLVEIPLPPSPSMDWDEVWKSLIEARNAFEQGGTTGWKGCVTAVRVALETWRKVESEQLGPGGSNQGNARDRTKDQRLDNLRWHLHHCTHYWVHNQEAQCSRDDALLMLSTLSALLAERKP
jgi:hypothetical protein